MIGKLKGLPDLYGTIEGDTDLQVNRTIGMPKFIS